MRDFWNNRYSVKEFVYGRTPNSFLKSYVDNECPATILLPAEGEGRNAVYAAKKGWQVFALDISEVAQNKALAWAAQNKVAINYEVVDLSQWQGTIEANCIGLIYAHFQPSFREELHKKLIGQLKKGGKVILEAFSKKQINYDSGGPGDSELLYDAKTLKNDFGSLKIEFLQERVVELDEGMHHKGEASIIRMIAKK